MRETVFPSTEYEPERLVCQHCRSEGLLSRKNGESMEQYASRRRRSWTPLIHMNSENHLSERHRSDMLLDLSGLTIWRVEEQASINHESDFDKVADALVAQHTRVHLRESRKRPKEKGKDPHQLRTSRLDSTTDSKTHAGPRRNSLHTKGIYRADHGTYIDTVLREIYDAYKAARSTPSNCDGGLADHAPKRQPDLATRMMLGQASLSSNGDYEQSAILQLSLDCTDRAVESITEFVSVRERSTHSEDNQTFESTER